MKYFGLGFIATLAGYTLLTMIGGCESDAQAADIGYYQVMPVNTESGYSYYIDVTRYGEHDSGWSYFPGISSTNPVAAGLVDGGLGYWQTKITLQPLTPGSWDYMLTIQQGGIHGVYCAIPMSYTQAYWTSPPPSGGAARIGTLILNGVSYPQETFAGYQGYWFNPQTAHCVSWFARVVQTNGKPATQWSIRDTTIAYGNVAIFESTSPDIINTPSMPDKFPFYAPMFLLSINPGDSQAASDFRKQLLAFQYTGQ